MGSRQIIAIGGNVLQPDDGIFTLERYILDASEKRRPRVCFVPTASGDDPVYIARFYESYARFACVLTHLPFFRRTPADLRALILGCDVVHVGGGNTRSMLAVWRHWGLDTILREAWNQGVVLAGSSAGMICWFAQGVTDSVASSLTTIEGLGFLPGSACPHYGSEDERRPTYRRMIEQKALLPGFAADDGVALHFIDEKLASVVSSHLGSFGYRIERRDDAVYESPLATRVLSLPDAKAREDSV